MLLDGNCSHTIFKLSVLLKTIKCNCCKFHHTQLINSLLGRNFHKVFQRDIVCSWNFVCEKESGIKDKYDVAYVWRKHWLKHDEWRWQKMGYLAERYARWTEILRARIFCLIERRKFFNLQPPKKLKIKCQIFINCQKAVITIGRGNEWNTTSWWQETEQEVTVLKVKYVSRVL